MSDQKNSGSQQKSILKAYLVPLVTLLASLGGLAVVIWFMAVLFDVKNLSSGFTLP